MKTICIFFLSLLSQTILTGQATTAISSAKINFVFLSNDTDGSISGFSSSSAVNLENPTNSVFKGEVRAETLDTGNFLRNWSLKGSKYFDVDKFPKITFESTEVTVDDNSKYSVNGKLTIKDITKPITITFTKNGKTLTGTTTLFSSDYGISIKKKKSDNKVSVTMVFTLE